jgi:hypothetical protein
MNINLRYIVTKKSDDGTFQKGDHICFYKDGAIGCTEAQGWIDKENVEEATKGMLYEVDKEWLKKKKKDLTKILELYE